MFLGFWRARKVDSATQIFVDSILIDKNCWFCFFNDQKSWSTRIVDSGLLNDQKCWFYSNTESSFCTPPGIRGLQIPTLLFLCWTETTKWVTESTKWTYTSTKWDTETAKWVTETTKWVSTKQQNGAQFLYHLKSYHTARRDAPFCPAPLSLLDTWYFPHPSLPPAIALKILIWEDTFCSNLAHKNRTGIDTT